MNSYIKFKSGMFYLSMLPLFITTLFLKVDIKEFKNTKGAITLNNCILFTVGCFIIKSIVGLLRFKDLTYNDKSKILQVTNYKSMNYEDLSFLATYIIPLMCFELENYKSLLVFILLIKMLSKIFVKSDLYYTNPTLILFNYHTFEVELEDNSKYILIIKGNIKKDDVIKYITIDEYIIYGRLLSYDSRKRY